MKRFFLTFLLINSFTARAQFQSITQNSNNIQFGVDLMLFKPPYVGELELKGNLNYNPKLYFSNESGVYYGYLGRPTLNATNIFEIGSYGAFAIRNLQVGSWRPRLYIQQDGNVGIDTDLPTAKLEVNGFTKLGSAAPAIQLKKITNGCTTSSSSGYPSGEIAVAHGLTASKILKAEVMVEYNTGYFVKDGNELFGYQFDITISPQSILIQNMAGSASSEIRSKPCKILITYEQ